MCSETEATESHRWQEDLGYLRGCAMAIALSAVPRMWLSYCHGPNQHGGAGHHHNSRLQGGVKLVLLDGDWFQSFKSKCACLRRFSLESNGYNWYRNWMQLVGWPSWSNQKSVEHLFESFHQPGNSHPLSCGNGDAINEFIWIYNVCQVSTECFFCSAVFTDRTFLPVLRVSSGVGSSESDSFGGGDSSGGGAGGDF